MMDFVAEPELAEAAPRDPVPPSPPGRRAADGMGVDMIWTGDDVGMQTGMLISPALWRRFLKPRMAELIARVKAINPAVKVAYHSDGMIWDVIPELIEIGVDVLNPVQPACMDPAELGRRFGDRLCFWGSLDEQHTLPFGSPDDVRAEVLMRLRTIGRERRPDPRPDAPRSARHAARELLGHGRDDPTEAVSVARSQPLTASFELTRKSQYSERSDAATPCPRRAGRPTRSNSARLARASTGRRAQRLLCDRPRRYAKQGSLAT